MGGVFPAASFGLNVVLAAVFSLVGVRALAGSVEEFL